MGLQTSLAGGPGSIGGQQLCQVRLLAAARAAGVRSERVSVPLVGSVTPKACSRRAPLAISGRYFSRCAALPWRSKVPMVYICA